MKKQQIKLSFRRAATIRGVSESTILRLVQRGTIHATEPALRNHHWTRSIIADRAFQNEETRRKNGLQAPRRKTIPTDVTKGRHHPTQTVTPAEGILEKARNAMNICLEAQKACDKDMQECRSRAVECKGESTHVDETASYVAHAKVACWSAERTCTRCTAILATACILQLILAAYYTICHFNII